MKSLKKNIVVCYALLIGTFVGASEHTVAITILAEAANQSETGQALVMAVILQRSIERNISLEEVCRERKQFSCWNNKTYKQLEYLLDTPEAKYALWLEVNPARIDLEATLKANHYHATWMRSKPYWAKDRKPLYVIEDHAFYRL